MIQPITAFLFPNPRCRECANGQTDLVIGADLIHCQGYSTPPCPDHTSSSSVKLHAKKYIITILVCQGFTGCQCSNLYINLADSKNGHNKSEDSLQQAAGYALAVAVQGVVFLMIYEHTAVAVLDSPQKGESSLSRSMIGGSFSIIKSISFSLL
jgi:hypothetical protein